MQRAGRVVAVQEGRLEVCFERPEACARCGACGGGKHFATVLVPGDAPVGSWVEVEMPERQILRASALAYVFPLLMLLAGLLAGMLLSDNEMLWALLALACMGAAWVALRWMDRRVSRREDWRPRIVAVHMEGEEKHGNEADKG